MINKSEEDIHLKLFKQDNPNGKWDEFRNHQSGECYNELKKHLFNDQYNLCAYCEVYLDPNPDQKGERRVEHFKSKSGSNIEIDNWHLDWFNLLGVCLGGEKSGDLYSLPDNLSCDAHKGHYEVNNNIKDKDWFGKVLFPCQLSSGHELFLFDKSTGMILPNENYCSKIEIENNFYKSTAIIVKNTIEIFNLNCDRLNKARLAILNEFNRCVTTSTQRNDITSLKNLVVRWNNSEPKFFQTTRDILMRDNVICQKIINKEI